MTKSRWYQLGHDWGAEYRATGLDPDNAPDPLSGEWAGQSIPEIFGQSEPPDQWLDDFEDGYYDAVYGNPISPRRRRIQKRIRSLPTARRPIRRRPVSGNPDKVPLGTTRKIETEGGMVIEGNPEGVTLHEAMEAVADWMDYESDVVEEAAEELREEGESELAAAAEDQAEAMEEAADQIHEAADEAREAAAVAFSEEGEPAAEIAAEESPEGEVVGGNPDLPPGSYLSDDNQVVHDEWWDGEWHPTHPGGEWHPWPTGAPLRTVITATGEELARFDPSNRVTGGNPDPPPLPVGGNEPPQPDPQGAAPATPAAGPIGGTPDIAPESNHWYKRPLIRRG